MSDAEPPARREAEPSTRRDGEPPTRRDDGLALVALLLGAALAYQGRHVAIELASGIALGLGGALLAVRGGRKIEGRGWLVCALLLGAGALCGCAILELYEEWQAGQWLASGPQSADAPAALHDLAQTVAGLRALGLAGSLAFLLGGVVNRMRTNEKGPD